MLLLPWKHTLSWSRSPPARPAPVARRATGYAAQWAALRAAGRVQRAVVTTEQLEAARKTFRRKTQVYLQQLLVMVFDELPTKSAARTALRQGRIHVNGCVVTAADAPAAQPGDAVTLHLGADALRIADDLEKRLHNWNDLRRTREEAQIRLLHSDPKMGLAVVNKPAGLDSVPWTQSHKKKRFTFQDYLPMVVPPPDEGTPCNGPKVCHRLDFRVAGPLLVATSLEAARRLKRLFAEQRVEKEYRAIVCGRVKEEGETFSIEEPLDGKASHTDVKVLQVVRCPHHGDLSMLALWPKTGRYRQLRRHLAEVLGRSIVNEDEGLFRAASARWLAAGDQRRRQLMCRHCRWWSGLAGISSSRPFRSPSLTTFPCAWRFPGASKSCCGSQRRLGTVDGAPMRKDEADDFQAGGWIGS